MVWWSIAGVRKASFAFLGARRGPPYHVSQRYGAITLFGEYIIPRQPDFLKTGTAKSLFIISFHRGRKSPQIFNSTRRSAFKLQKKTFGARYLATTLKTRKESQLEDHGNTIHHLLVNAPPAATHRVHPNAPSPKATRPCPCLARANRAVSPDRADSAC